MLETHESTLPATTLRTTTTLSSVTLASLSASASNGMKLPVRLSSPPIVLPLYSLVCSTWHRPVRPQSCLRSESLWMARRYRLLLISSEATTTSSSATSQKKSTSALSTTWQAKKLPLTRMAYISMMRISRLPPINPPRRRLRRSLLLRLRRRRPRLVQLSLSGTTR